MDDKLKTWLRGYLGQHNGDIESCARWMARTFPEAAVGKMYRGEITLSAEGVRS